MPTVSCPTVTSVTSSCSQESSFQFSRTVISNSLNLNHQIVTNTHTWIWVVGSLHHVYSYSWREMSIYTPKWPSPILTRLIFSELSLDILVFFLQTFLQNLQRTSSPLERKNSSVHLVLVSLLRHGIDLISVVCGCKASHTRSMFLMTNSSYCKISLQLRPNPVGPPWVSGDINFEVDENELQIQFRVQHGILRPHQNLHVKGGSLVDASKLKVMGEITIWGKSHRRDHYVVRWAHVVGCEEAPTFGVQEHAQYGPRMHHCMMQFRGELAFVSAQMLVSRWRVWW